jgi:hypothetical protein
MESLNFTNLLHDFCLRSRVNINLCRSLGTFFWLKYAPSFKLFLVNSLKAEILFFIIFLVTLRAGYFINFLHKSGKGKVITFFVTLL